MVQHYSIKDFFRQMPNALLSRYFKTKGLFSELDFAAMKEGKPDELFAAWLALTDKQRNAMDAEFREIFEMSCEKGFRAIIDEAEFQLADEEFTAFVEKLSALPSHFERAMITFLDFNSCWKGANRFHHADTLPYWRKRKHLPHKPAAVDDASIDELANKIRNYFHLTEGRGNNCVVEPFRRGELEYFFAYPEDYSQRSIEWENGIFNPRPHNPAFEVIFVYSQKEGSLDLNFRGSYKALEPLQSMFATAILKLDELPPDPKDPRIYDLNPLLQKSFDFNYAVGSGIESVRVKKLRLSSRVKKGDRVTLEADASQAPDAVYTMLDQISKPKKPQFFRTHASDDMTFPAMILENKEARESYVVVPEVAQEVSELVRPVMLHAAIDRQNNVSLIPVPLPGEDGTRNPWHESLAQAVEHAKLKWIRITANMHAGGYDVYEAEGELPEPEWPAHDIDALVQVAFRGKIITSLDHPVVQTLLGKI